MAHAQDIESAGLRFVFSDGHGLAAFTQWFDDLTSLDNVDWTLVGQRYWTDNVSDMDRMRRKQAEFLIHASLDWSLIREIAVIDVERQQQVRDILSAAGAMHRPAVLVRREWYYW